MSASSLQERLLSLQGEKTARRFAREMGISDSTYRSIMSGGSPTLDTLLLIQAGTGVSLDWLAGQDVPKLPAEPHGNGEITGIGSDFALLPRYSVSASAGTGLVAHEELEIERIAFRRDWLHDIGLDPGQAGLLTATGDSMYPTIPDGALMLVDRRAGQGLMSGYIYVIVLDGEVLVKRLSRNVDGTIDLISDNPIYPIQKIKQTDFDRLFVAGRVFWVGRKI
jgi:phage repressor protein C with HTH and peptisase S24 domain